MAPLKLWMAADAVAHFLYTPTTRGKRSGRARWHHRLHLIPGRLFRRICDGAERFYENAEPKGARPIGYRCQHMSVHAGGATLTNVSSGCGCKLEPIYS